MPDICYVSEVDEPIKIIERPDGQERMLIMRRSDGHYTFRHQWVERIDGADSWGPMGLDCGIYDSIDTAEAEAMQRTKWLKAGFH